MCSAPSSAVINKDWHFHIFIGNSRMTKSQQLSCAEYVTYKILV